MPRRFLTPKVSFLSKEYVLVQAWKKAHDHIRRHNWYSDVLELDLTNADLQNRLEEIAAELRSEEPLRSEPLRLVLAPKSQKWNVQQGVWAPIKPRTAEDKKATPEKRLRPLAHLSVRDQIIGTAFMMLFADLIENLQRDPRGKLEDVRARRVVSYGHRLYCDTRRNGQLRFCWGSSQVYRLYSQDYQQFLARPHAVVREEFGDSKDWAIVHADLSQFYDRVRPAHLFRMIGRLAENDAEAAVMQKFESFFKWRWHPSDLDEALNYAEKAEPRLEGFDNIALPQGLVASGFFANAYLIDFDRSIQAWIDEAGNADIQPVDYCRYVDDMRLVVRLNEKAKSKAADEIAEAVSVELNRRLQLHAPKMQVNKNKSTALLGREADAGTIPVSATMKRINQDTSGALDLFRSEEALDLLEGLMFNQPEEPLDFPDRFRDTFFAAKADVRDETVARFAAHRFRRTYRSLRPLCEASLDNTSALLPSLTQESLDQRAQAFSRRLIERWARDPSHMRLLRIALDVYPSEQNLDVVLHLLGPFFGTGKRRKAPRRVAWYCAAELLKAGATETGLVPDKDALPAGIELPSYQAKLAEFAKAIVARRSSYPWYLQQQALLFLACIKELEDRRVPPSTNAFIRNYLRLHQFMRERTQGLSREDLVPFVLVIGQLTGDFEAAGAAFLSSFREKGERAQLRMLQRILQESEEVAKAVHEAMTPEEVDDWRQVYEAHGLLLRQSFPKQEEDLPEAAEEYALLDVARSPINPFQQEYAALQFGRVLLPMLQSERRPPYPYRIRIRAPWKELLPSQYPFPLDHIQIEFTDDSEPDVRFAKPAWCREAQAWKYHLGQVLRVLLIGNPDYTSSPWSSVRAPSSVLYKPYGSSWLRRRYGMFNGRRAFGPPWLPISSWFCTLLTRLLAWPGFPQGDDDFDLEDDAGLDQLDQFIAQRILELEGLHGRASKTPMLSLRVPWRVIRRRNKPPRPVQLRVGVVQTVHPRKGSFADEIEQNSPEARRQNRFHLSAVMGGVHRMLQVRETHQSNPGVDLLVLPELSVHPDDVKSHLVRFAKQYRCIVLAGVVFHPPLGGIPSFVNSAYWLVPHTTQRGTLEVDFVEQGKWNLTKDEQDLGIHPFRPAQWLIDFVNPKNGSRLWTMTGAICFDATDLGLAADLRDRTDMFVVPALNKDVGTFDNMVAALHFHMFQHVIVANNGEFGGSTGQAPFDERHRRTIFHSHGSDQVSISFFEVDMDLYRRDADARSAPAGKQKRPLKSPPAGFVRH